MDRLEAMAMLVKVVETGSLSAAGRVLHVPLATLSRKIADLEMQLGTRLLIRTTRKLSLTDAGQTYVTAARRILEDVEVAEREAAGEFTIPKGELVITAPLMFGRLHVLPVVTDFLAASEQITVRLVLSDRNVNLVDDHVDMAVRIGKLPDSSMVATPIGTMRTVTCACPALLEKFGEPTTPDELRGFPSVAVNALMLSQAWRFRNAESGELVSVSMRPRLSVTTTEAAADAAINGVGIAQLLHYQVAEGVRSGKLKIILSAHEQEPTPVHLLHVSRGYMPLKMRRFLDFAAPRLNDALSAIATIK